jgi:hypothetical protein
MVFGAIVALGAITYWAVSDQGVGVQFSTVERILIATGAADFMVSSIEFATSSRSVGGGRLSLNDNQIDWVDDASITSEADRNRTANDTGPEGPQPKEHS